MSPACVGVKPQVAGARQGESNGVRQPKVSSTGDRKKLRNLQADPRVTLLFIDPAMPFRTVEVRGTATTAVDEGLVVQTRIGEKYSSDVTSFDSPGTIRYVITIGPDRVNTFG
jgi:hypothetical protein